MYNKFLKVIAEAENKKDFSEELKFILDDLSKKINYQGNLLSFELESEGIYRIDCVYIEGLAFNGQQVIKQKNISKEDVAYSKKFNKKEIGKLTYEAVNKLYKYDSITETEDLGSVEIDQIVDYNNMVKDEIKFYTAVLTFIAVELRHMLHNKATVFFNPVSNAADELYFKDGKWQSSEYANELIYFISYINESCSVYFQNFVADFLESLDYIDRTVSQSVMKMLSTVYQRSAATYFSGNAFKENVASDLAYFYKVGLINTDNLSEFFDLIPQIENSNGISSVKDEILDGIKNSLPNNPNEISSADIQSLGSNTSVVKSIAKYVETWFTGFLNYFVKEVQDNLKTNILKNSSNIYNTFCKLIVAKTPEQLEKQKRKFEYRSDIYKLRDLLPPGTLDALREYLNHTDPGAAEGLEEELTSAQLSDIIESLRQSDNPDIIYYADQLDEVAEEKERELESEITTEDKKLELDYLEKRNEYFTRAKEDVAEELGVTLDDYGNLDSEVDDDTKKRFDTAVSDKMKEFDDQNSEKSSGNKDVSKDAYEEVVEKDEDDIAAEHSIFGPAFKNADLFINFRNKSLENRLRLRNLDKEIDRIRASKKVSSKNLRSELLAAIKRSDLPFYIKQSLHKVLVVKTDPEMCVEYLKSVLDIHDVIQDIFSKSKSFSDARKRIGRELNRHRDIQYYFEYGTTNEDLKHKRENVQPYLDSDNLLLQKKFIQWLKGQGYDYDAKHNELSSDGNLLNNEQLSELVKEFNTKFKTNLEIDSLKSIRTGKEFNVERVVLKPISEFVKKEVNIKNLNDVNIMQASSIDEAINNLNTVYSYLENQVNEFVKKLKLK